MPFEIFMPLLSAIAKFVSTIADWVSNFFMVYVPKLFVFRWEMARRTVSWLVSEYVSFKAELKWTKLKKPKKLFPRG
jgi:hypothetical protein